MFTGIIEETGIVKSISGKNLTVSCEKILEDTKLGDSIAINGCCQTVVKITPNDFSVEVSDETFRVTNFNNLKSGDEVNLERAVTPRTRLGGHIVQGHVEGVAKLVHIEKLNEFYNLSFEFEKEFEKYIAYKGSVTLNGVSLTVAKLDGNILTVAVIPHTYSNTNLNLLKSGDTVNLETDILAKYVEKFLSTTDNKIDENFLAENGFM